MKDEAVTCIVRIKKHSLYLPTIIYLDVMFLQLEILDGIYLLQLYATLIDI